MSIPESPIPPHRHRARLAGMTRELRAVSASIQKVPVREAFQGLSALVAGLCEETGKEIDLVIDDGDAALDAAVAKALAAPLAHLVCNAADHGVEPPHERERAGKLRAGRVAVRAYQQAGDLVLEVGDDGRGLRRDRILEQAAAAGLVSAGGGLTEAEVFALIFHPGLSTADPVMAASGDGLGMDVVRRNVEALGGRVEIASKAGVGTTFTLRLPPALAVADGLIVRLGAERYVIPIAHVEQSLRPADAGCAAGGETCRIGDRAVPVVRPHALLAARPPAADPAGAMVVVVRDAAGRRCGVLVDEVVGQQQVLTTPLGDGRGPVPGVCGGAILSDGHVGLILDAPALLDLGQRVSPARAA